MIIGEEGKEEEKEERVLGYRSGPVARYQEHDIISLCHVCTGEYSVCINSKKRMQH